MWENSHLWRTSQCILMNAKLRGSRIIQIWTSLNLRACLGVRCNLITRGEHLMKKSLSALLLGLVMLAGTENSQAADVAQKNTQSKAVPAPIVVADAQKLKTV